MAGMGKNLAENLPIGGFLTFHLDGHRLSQIFEKGSFTSDVLVA